MHSGAAVGDTRLQLRPILDPWFPVRINRHSIFLIPPLRREAGWFEKSFLKNC
jgi:hypothetical protein